MKFYILILSIIVLVSCKQTPKGKTLHFSDTASLKSDSLTKEEARHLKNSNFKSLDQIEEEVKQLKDTNYKYLKAILARIVDTVRNHSQESYFAGEIDSNQYHFKELSASFQFGHIFDKRRKHLLVKRFINEYGSVEISLFTDIYLLENNKFRKVVADTADIGFSDDTLIDVNLDSYKDYMVSQYSGAGCCPRDSKIVYLYNRKTGGFSSVDLFNPEFDNKNRTVFEMDYGQPGLVSIEKSKWIGLSKVKIESYYPTHFQSRMDSFVKPYSFTRTSYPSERSTIVPNIPEEYKKLDCFEYFISYQK